MKLFCCVILFLVLATGPAGAAPQQAPAGTQPPAGQPKQPPDPAGEAAKPRPADPSLEGEAEAPVITEPSPEFLLEPPIIHPELPATAPGLPASIGRPGYEEMPPPPGEVVKALFGFVFLLVLAVLASHPKAQALERRLYISQLVTAGLPFVLLGVVARLPQVGVLSDRVLQEIAPLLPLGLGLIGFTLGFRFEGQLFLSLPKGTGTAVLLTTLLPFGAIVAGAVLVLVWTESLSPDTVFLRDALLLATAGAVPSRLTPYLLETLGGSKALVERFRANVQLEQLVGVFGLMLVAAYFRPQGAIVNWQLPGTAWVFITFGVGTTMGALIYAVIGKISKGAQFTVVTLGSVCFAAGMASFLRLSPVAVCFIAGAILVNIPSAWKGEVREALEKLERPVYYLFLTIAGALWTSSAWQGWALIGILVVARYIGKWVALEILRRQAVIEIVGEQERALASAPIGALSIAIVISAQDLYSGPTVSWIVTAVIGGAILTEIFVQVILRGRGMVNGRAMVPAG